MPETTTALLSYRAYPSQPASLTPTPAQKPARGQFDLAAFTTHRLPCAKEAVVAPCAMHVHAHARRFKHSLTCACARVHAHACLSSSVRTAPCGRAVISGARWRAHTHAHAGTRWHTLAPSLTDMPTPVDAGMSWSAAMASLRTGRTASAPTRRAKTACMQSEGVAGQSQLRVLRCTCAPQARGCGLWRGSQTSNQL